MEDKMLKRTIALQEALHEEGINDHNIHRYLNYAYVAGRDSLVFDLTRILKREYGKKGLGGNRGYVIPITYVLNNLK